MRFTGRTLTAALAATALLAGCASTPSVRFDYDKSADFGQFPHLRVPRPGRRSQVAGNADARGRGDPRDGGPGLQARAADPDLLVNFTGKLEDRTDVQSVPGRSYGPAWGYGGWYGAPYGGWNSQQVTTRHYKVGSLVMDIVDRAKRQVVFQAGIEKTVTKEMMTNRDQAINAAVTRMFATYPFVAGQSAPVAPPEKK